MSDQLEPFVSIIMPVYNRELLVSESLDSILNINYSNWECIIVDDHSTDATLKIAKAYVEKDTRFRIFNRPENKPKGANSCRNYGLTKAEGKYIHWFDSDDIAHPDYLKISISLIEKFKVDFCRFNRETFQGEFTNVFRKQIAISEIENVNVQHIEKLLKNELSFNTCNVVWKKSSLGSERFNETIVYGDEWEFYPRLLVNGLKGVSIENVLFYGRKHIDSTTYEFWNHNPERRNSKVKAVKSVIDTLEKGNLLSPSLIKYFLQTGFFLKSPTIIDYILQKSDAGLLKRLKYKWGYELYPIIRPVLKFKGVFKA